MIRYMNLKLLLAALTMLLCGQVAWPDYRLHILHINDLHSRLEPINRFDSTCDPQKDAAGECFGGIARVASKIDELRNDLHERGENVIVLDAGDQFQGSLLYTTFKGQAAAEFMEIIGFDAMVIGNHEFDDGPQVLAEFIKRVDFPVMAGNLDLRNSDALNEVVVDRLVLDVGGQRIGIVSALTTDTEQISKPGSDVVFLDEVDAIRNDVAELQADGINKIIAVTHTGINRDIEIAAAVSGIDAIVGGHSHTFMSASAADRDREYPVRVVNPDGHHVPVVQAYAFSKYIGHLVLEFDDLGILTNSYGDTILLDHTVVPDSSINSRLTELMLPVRELARQVVAHTTTGIDGQKKTCRVKECAMGNLVADAMLDSVRDQGYSIAIQNGGGLRASIDAGDITTGEILTVLPFQNTLATFRASGAILLEALEHGVSEVEESAGRFLQVAGLRFSWDSGGAPGKGRIREVFVNLEDNWQALDPDRFYGIVTNEFVRQGGDGYQMFATIENAYDYGQKLDEVVIDFLRRNTPYSPYTDGRIQHITDS